MSGTAELKALVKSLEQRLLLVEDQLAIHRLINSWGPAVDGDNPEAAAAIWDRDGVLVSDVQNTRLEGSAAIARMVREPGHQQLIHTGSAHIQSFPVVTVDGDTAKAVGFSRVYLHKSEGGHEVWRVSANRWDLRRTEVGWRIVKRINQVIDGRPEAREVLNQAFTPDTR